MTGAGLSGIAMAFFCGSLPFGYWIPRFGYRTDIRRHGSGNPGATNVYRTIGRNAGLAVGALDFLKGWAGVAIMDRWAPETGAMGQVVAAVAAVAGHNWSPWLGFRGGKGILTSAGAFTRIAPVPVAGAMLVFAVGLALTGFVSVGSMAAAVALPCLVALIPGPWRNPVVETASAIIGIMAIIRHRSNIRNLIKGTEMKPGKTRKPSGAR